MLSKSLVEGSLNGKTNRFSIGFLFYLFVIGSYPLVFLYTANQHKISSLNELWPWLSTTMYALAFLFLLTWLFFKNRKKAALLSSFISFWWLSLQLYALPLMKILAGLDLSCSWNNLNLIVKVFWLVGFAFGIFQIARLKEVPPFVDAFMTNTAIVLLAISLFSIGNCEFGRAKMDRQMENHPLERISDQSIERPNIYFIVLDAYARADSLKKNFDFNNEGFLSELKSRGFYIDDKSWSNYCRTVLSLSSTLNLDYLDNILAQNKEENVLVHSDKDDAIAFKLIARSKSARFLRERGYRFIAVSSYITDFEGADLCKTISSVRTPFDNTAFEMLSLRHIMDFFNIPELDPQRALRRKNLLDCIDIITGGSDQEAPLFVMGHILAPHPPFVFKSDGGLAQGVMCTWDGSEYFKRAADKELYKVQYIEQLKWVNSKVLEMVDTIEKKSSRPSIIIVEGDHGSALNYDCDTLEKTNICERFANLMAIKPTPRIKANDLDEFHTPINIFRFLFSQCFNTNYPLLPERSYYSSVQEPFKFIDISPDLRQCSQPSATSNKEGNGP